jgi:hypothetical protein
MNKLWVIAFKDIRTRFTDRRLLLIMIAAPLAISTIFGLAFGGLGRTNSPIRDIPVAVINNDQNDSNGTSYGSMLTDLLTEGQLPADTNSFRFARKPRLQRAEPTGGERPWQS